MSRLQKTRTVKRKKRFWARLALLAISLSLVAAAAWHFFLPEQSTAPVGDPDSLLINPDRTTAFVDFLGITYLNISVVDSKAIEEVWAGGVALVYEPEHDQWRARLGGYQKGDVITVTAIGTDGTVQEKVMTLVD